MTETITARGGSIRAVSSRFCFLRFDILKPLPMSERTVKPVQEQGEKERYCRYDVKPDVRLPLVIRQVVNRSMIVERMISD